MDCQVCFAPYALPQRVPQVLPCGHTFCKECVTSLNHAGRVVCPTCRQPCQYADIHINFALRDALPGAGVAESQRIPVPPALERLSTAQAPTEEERTVEISISAEPCPHNPACLDMMISMLPPTGTRRTPSDICCVVDVSDSMGVEAMIQDSPGITVTHGLSVLDVVKHALRTIVHNLGEHDRLSVVAFADNAKVAFNLTPMGEDGKRVAERHLSGLHTDGMTNLWAGLQMGIEVLQAAQEPGRLQHLMLLTDGLPTYNPPRGIMPMLKRLREKAEKDGGVLPCTINTFGFGYELDSELLREISITGGGTYAFIPDAGFVGTIFVNAMTNLLVTMATNVSITLTLHEGTSFPANPVLGNHRNKLVGNRLHIDLTSLQFGQRKDVIVQVVAPSAGSGEDYLEASVCYNARTTDTAARRTERVVKARGIATPKFEIEPQRCRLLFVDGIRTAMQMMKLSSMDKMRGVPLPLPEVQASVDLLGQKLSASRAASSEAMQALCEDLSGQVAESVSRQDWYEKWGVHYLPSLMCAHLAQQCNNFKDPGVQHYGGDLFCDLRDNADDIFCQLPAPTPSARPPPVPARAAAPAAAATALPTVVSRAPAPVSMASYYDRFSG